MASPLKLCIDRQNQKLVVTSVVPGTAAFINDLFQGNTRNLEVTIVDPTGLLSPNDFAKVDAGSFGLRVSVGATPTGTAGGPTPLTIQTTFAWDSANKKFTGDLALNTAGVDSHIGTAAQAIAYFEVNITDGGGRITILQTQITLRAVVDEATANVPIPGETYLTSAEQLALFAKYVNDPGVVIVLKSPNGLYGRELGVADDGSAIDNLITL